MKSHDIDFQIVTQNLSNGLDEKLRVFDNVAPSWNYVVIFSAMLILVLIKQLAPKQIKLLMSMFFQTFDTEKVTREWNPLTSFSGYAFGITYIALIALFLQKSILIYSGNSILYGGSNFYLEMCIFTSAYIIIQYLIVNVIGWLFKTEIASQHQAITRLSMISHLNGFLIILLLVMTFHPMKIFVIIGIAIIMIYTIFRLIKTFFEFQFLIKNATFKIFLYFCTLEILPFSVAFTMAFRLVATNSVL